MVQVPADPRLGLGCPGRQVVQFHTVAPDLCAAKGESVQKNHKNNAGQLHQMGREYGVQPALNITGGQYCARHDVDQDEANEEQISVKQVASPQFRRRSDAGPLSLFHMSGKILR